MITSTGSGVCVDMFALNRRLKDRDSDLFAKKQMDGNVDIMRKARRGIYVIEQYIFSLTTNWRPSGIPVSWGLDQIMNHINDIDSHRNDKFYEEMMRERERTKAIKERSKSNEIRALAADCRKDFAKATNEINTSTLKKVDNRRKKDGNL